MKLPTRIVLLQVLLSTVATVSAQDCFNSTSAMLQAQAQGQRDLVICPDTTINIGTPTDVSYSDFIDGDFPLTVLADNTTIKCGEDGSSSNNCVLHGGVIQMATTPQISQAPGVLITTHNLHVKGLTFSGTLGEIVGYPTADGEVSLSAAVSISAPGHGMVFEDIVFSTHGRHVFTLERNTLAPYEAFPAGAASVTVKDSKVIGAGYRRDVFETRNQTLILDNVVIQDLAYNGGEDCTNCSELILDNVVYATGGDLQLNNVEFTNVTFAAAAVYIRGDSEQTTYSIDGITGSDWFVYNETERDPSTFCKEGLIVATSPVGSLNVSGGEDKCFSLLEAGKAESEDESGSDSAQEDLDEQGDSTEEATGGESDEGATPSSALGQSTLVAWWHLAVVAMALCTIWSS